MAQLIFLDKFKLLELLWVQDTYKHTFDKVECLNLTGKQQNNKKNMYKKYSNI